MAVSSVELDMHRSVRQRRCSAAGPENNYFFVTDFVRAFDRIAILCRPPLRFSRLE